MQAPESPDSERSAPPRAQGSQSPSGQGGHITFGSDARATRALGHPSEPAASRLTVTHAGQRREIACDALLFDMDGVLVDSMPIITRHLCEWAARHGLDEHRVLAFSHGRTYEELIRGLAPSLDVELEAKRCVSREIADVAGIGPCPGALELVAALEDFAWAIVTSAYRPVAEARLRAAGISPPGVVVTAGDVDCGKPNPQGYLMAASRLGVAPSRCVVLDDAPTGVEAGRAAGCQVIAVGGNHERLIADFVVPNLQAVAVGTERQR